MERRNQKTLRAKAKSLPEHGEDGVDPTLIRWMLSLTPAQRLRAAQDTARSLMRMRAGRTKT